VLSGKKYWIILGVTLLALAETVAVMIYATMEDFLAVLLASSYSFRAIDVVLSFLYAGLVVFLFRLIAQKTSVGIWYAGTVFIVLVFTYFALITGLNDTIPDAVGVSLAVFYLIISFPMYGIAFLFAEIPELFYAVSVILYGVLLAEQIIVRSRYRRALPAKETEESEVGK